MKKRYIVIGGVAGGASAAARIRRLDENADIQIYDKGPDISFSNCCLPNFFSGEIKNTDDLILHNPQSFKETFNLDALTNHEVIEIKADQHKIIVRNLLTMKEFEDTYDYLILSPGAHAIKPSSIKNVDSNNVFTVKNVNDIRMIDEYLNKKNVKDVAVIGGGFIGVEVAECMRKSGKNISLVEASNQILNNFDYDMIQMLHKELYDNGIKLILSDSLVEINDSSILLKSGKVIEAQAVILAIGVKPSIDFAIKSGIKTGQTGAILVNHNYMTNLQDVYAIGDCIETFNSITNEKMKLALAGPAQKQARNVADALFGKSISNTGVIGSSCIRLFDMNAASTGLNESQCIKNNIDYRTSFVMPNDKVGLMPDANPIHLKVIYQYPSGKILGSQAIGKGNVIQRVNVIATLISMNAKLEDMKELELCYAPAFSTAKDAVNFAALAGLNYLNGEYKQISHTKVRDLVENGEYIIDVRGRDAYEKSHIIGAKNIPIEEIRNRIEEIPRDKTVYVHCRTSWNSYYVIQALKGYGFYNIVNIQGSFLALSYYEYFNDMTSDRKSILTGYNFE
ncbi:FAD-dependent oxidoreductase [Peptostreptococcus equinus]|uniref:FAD-dependent oxidoreductase n=1 Tax=Peptostreptococcus equinus TaxID=3003601 RepID=A0ABY7JQW8_9FIRM|nr:FAD-dependent oxidoreductase [Peptostreptococcus sp. CBA3647]WAW14894.1 FAD-dependent oxidoreductase [Peptostreptococcus sp. CBA3647]